MITAHRKETVKHGEMLCPHCKVRVDFLCLENRKNQREAEDIWKCPECKREFERRMK